MAAHFFKVGRGFRRQDGFHTICAICRIVARRTFKPYDLLPAFDDPLSEQEARSQLDIVAWGAHGYAQRLPANSDFQRLFGGEAIILATQLAVVPFGDLR